MKSYPGIDMEEALLRLMGNHSLLERVLRNFVCEFNTRLPGVKTQIEHNEFAKLNLFFHTVKGMASNIACEPVHQLCTQGEMHCCAKDTQAISAVVNQLASRLDILNQALSPQGSHI